MRRPIPTKLWITVILAVWAVSAAANQNYISGDILLRHFQSDRTLTYQGILKNASGQTVPDANYNLTFRLYNAPSGGGLLWTSSIIQVATVSGYFTTQLGPISLPFDTTYYLSFQAQSDPEMSQSRG